MYVYWNLKSFCPKVKVKPLPSRAAQLTNHMVAIKPTVPKTLIGGKSETVLMPLFFRMVNAVVLARASVGI